MIIVTGANGQLGRAIVENLLELIPADQIGVSVRDPEKAYDLVQRGVRVRQGDFADPASLAAAFADAAQVLIVSSNSSGAQAVQHHRAAIDAAKAVGAKRVLYTSHMGSNPASHFAPMRDHAATEEALRESGLAFTSLRNGYYASSARWMLGNAVETGELAAPADGDVSWTAHADLAKVAALALTQGVLDGITPALTASVALDLLDIAEIASGMTRRGIWRVVVPDDEFRARLIAGGTPAPVADMVIGMYVAIRAGEFAHVDPTLERLLGRPPMTMREVLRDTL